jgi:oligosaccharide translocation protein RFT1
MAGDDAGVLAGAAKSAAYTMSIQGMFRLLTFAMNSVMLHHITRDLLGVANVRLVLLNQTILFLSYEAFRRACLSKIVDRCWPQVVNLLWFTVPLGIFWTGVCGCLWLYVWEPPDPQVVPFYQTAVYWFCASSLIEIVIQPLAIIGQILLMVELKAVIEGLALLLKCIITVTLVVNYPELGLKSFCYAQLLYAVIMLLMYYLYFTVTVTNRRTTADFPYHSIRDFFPRSILGKPFVCQELSWLVGSFCLQSFLKHFLTEGEKIIMTVLGVVSFADQGVYEVVSNLGSLPARILFLPMEDALYLFFTKTLHRGRSAVHQPEESAQLAGHVLQSMIKVCVLIGLIFITFGYSYSFLLLDLYGGRVLSDGSGPLLLRWYCAYVLLTAMNGVTEGFKNATMSDSQVNRFSRMMVLFTVVSISSSWLLTLRYGSVGLIWSNCINMALRVVHSFYYIRRFFCGCNYSPHTALLPCCSILMAFLAAWFITMLSEKWLCCSLSWYFTVLHVGIGGLCLLMIAITVYTFDKQFVLVLQNEIYPLIRRRSPSNKLRLS